MRPNKTKAKLMSNQIVIGAAMSIPSPELVELSAAVGFDFVSIDIEHEPMSKAAVVQMIRAAEAFDITPIVRVAKDPDLILQYMDAGAQGIHVPLCSSPADLRSLVEWTRFYPQGKRTFYATGRSANYAMGIDDRAWSQEANEQLLVIAMIEEAEALPHLDEMLSIPHVDVIHIGPKDLWQSMGMPDARVVDETVARITEAAVSAGKQVSLQFRLTPDLIRKVGEYVLRGGRMVTVSPFDFIREGAPALAKELREMAASPPGQQGTY